MSLFKLLLYFLIAYVALTLVRRLFDPAGRRANNATRRNRHVRESDRMKSTRMVRCESCGTFIAERRALLLGERGFCSPACMEKMATRAPNVQG